MTVDNFYILTNADDEDVQLRIAAFSKDGKLSVTMLVSDCKGNAWMTLTPDEAEQLANQLIEFARIVREQNANS